MTQYPGTDVCRVPWFVLRGLVAAANAADYARDVFGDEAHVGDDPTIDRGYWAALKWLADRPIYREQCLTDELVEAVYAPDHVVTS